MKTKSVPVCPTVGEFAKRLSVYRMVPDLWDELSGVDELLKQFGSCAWIIREQDAPGD